MPNNSVRWLTHLYPWLLLESSFVISQPYQEPHLCGSFHLSAVFLPHGGATSYQVQCGHQKQLRLWQGRWRGHCLMRARRWPARLLSACCRMASRASASAARTTGPSVHQVQLQVAAASWCAVCSGPGQVRACAWSWRRRDAGMAMWILGSVRTSTRLILWSAQSSAACYLLVA